jgi:microcystin-dependent protein
MFNNPFLGLVIPFAGTAAPAAWMFCQGQELEIEKYHELFSVIGLSFGGNGYKTFALPNLCGRVAVHAGQAPQMPLYTAGETGGNETEWITISNLPAHDHQVTEVIMAGAPCTNDYGKGNTPTNNYTASVQGFASAYSTAPDDTIRMGSTIITGSTQPAPIVTGEIKAPVYVVSPFLTMNYIICIEGLFPPRG